MSYLEQLQIKKTPVKNSQFLISLLGESESTKKIESGPKPEKEEAGILDEKNELEEDVDKEDELKEIKPQSEPFFVDKTQETRLDRNLILAKIKRGFVVSTKDEETTEVDE